MKLYKQFLLVFILFCLAAPVLQYKLNYFTEKPLKGDVHLAENTKITRETWFSSAYQSAKEKYINDNFGFRSFYVRLRNQVCYTLFRKVFAKDVIAGKSGFLYERKYLETHSGLDYLGDARIDKLFEKIKFVQDTLGKKGIKFALLFAPGKATYYPEYIPFPYERPAAVTNYFKFIEEAKNKGIHHIDFNNWFALMKPNAKYPLYPQTGTHWSTYGIDVAFDSITKYMSSALGKKMLRFDYSEIEETDPSDKRDEDIAAGLNLLQSLPHFKMAFPIVKFKDTMNTFRPRVVTIADSYWMGIYFTGLPEKVFSKHEFWYYNKMLYNYDPEGKTDDVLNYDLKNSIEKNDFIFIMATEASLKNFGWGIVDELHDLYKYGPYRYELSKRDRRKKSEINHIKYVAWNDEAWFAKIKKQADELHMNIDSCIEVNALFHYNEVHKNDPPVIMGKAAMLADRATLVKAQIIENKEWYNSIKLKAAKWNITVDSCIDLDANWVAKNQLFDERVAYYKSMIRKTPEWLKQVEEKSKNWKLPLDSCISIDARYMVEQENKKSDDTVK